MAHRLSYSEACGIFLDQGLNPHLLIDRQTLIHCVRYLFFTFICLNEPIIFQVFTVTTFSVDTQLYFANQIVCKCF